MKHAPAAAKFLTDYERASWHDAAIWFVRNKRDRAAQKLPEWEQLRMLAAQIKRHTLAHLADYLEQFEREATRRGMVIHWAATAADHNRIVLDLLRQRSVRLLVKSKSMLTEECGLNPVLEAAGIEVVDTDLGERIVQMRREHPSHIVLPAIHIRKEEVGELFHERLGTEAGSADPDYLTYAARLHLREKLLAAQAGLTGVNFAIAETGALVVCTNEGNADLGTALPPLHIASMGIEKLLPSVAHLGVFLRLLARSATGQPITTYSSHFAGPRDGGELHVVLVDNGRSALLGQPDFRDSLACIRCGACLNTCPVYRRSGGHSYHATIPGPIGSVLGPAREPQSHATLPFACTLCGSCTEVCPVKIPLHHQLLAFRSVLARKRLVPLGKRWSMHLAATVFRRPWLYRSIGHAARWGLRLLPRWLVYHRWNPWGLQRDLPTPPKASFREQFRNRQRNDSESRG